MLISLVRYMEQFSLMVMDDTPLPTGLAPKRAKGPVHLPGWFPRVAEYRAIKKDGGVVPVGANTDIDFIAIACGLAWAKHANSGTYNMHSIVKPAPEVIAALREEGGYLVLNEQEPGVDHLYWTNIRW